MTDWTDGYIADIGYTFGYYQELNPLRSQLPFLSIGLVAPPQGTHCALGFGQGLCVNIHAAATISTWYGCDFNPAQAGYAQLLAQASATQAHLSNKSFAEFCIRPDLPSFDSIGLHGIWRWINDDNRSMIVDFVRHKLKVGGALYISYNNPLAVCQQHDTTGPFAKARLDSGFALTGIKAPYAPQQDADLRNGASQPNFQAAIERI